jgi:exopolysaccharide biosynthesis operon protein EpsL
MNSRPPRSESPRGMRGNARRQARVARPAVALALACAALFARDAAALWDDRLELFIGESAGYDSNVFRISNDANTLLSTGSDSKSDHYWTTTFGFILDVPVSRQHLRASLAWIDNRYHRFSELNFTGHDAKASWLWEAGNNLKGEVGYNELYTLASFATTQERVPDPLKTRRAYAQAQYLVTPRWRIDGNISELEQRNKDVRRQDNDVDVRNADVGLNYVSPAGNSIGAVVRNEEGRYPNRQVVAGSAFDNAYTQDGAGVVTDWTITPKSHVNARVDYVRRKFNQLSSRDYEGTLFRVLYDWTPTSKLSFATVVQRDISALEEQRTSFVLIKGISVRPRYQITERIALSGLFEYSVRDYLGDPASALGTLPTRSDHVRSYLAELSYKPYRRISVNLSVLREVRTSNIALTDYAVTVAQAGVRVAF